MVLFIFMKFLNLLLWPVQFCHRCCCSCRRKGDGGEPISRADLGQKSNFYFDKDKGMWVQTGQEHLAKAAAPPPPPPTIGAAPAMTEPSKPVAAPTMLDNMMAPPSYSAGAFGRPVVAKQANPGVAPPQMAPLGVLAPQAAAAPKVMPPMGRAPQAA